MYMSIFSQHNYIYSLLCVLQHYMFRPFVRDIIRCVWRLSHKIHGGGGVDLTSRHTWWWPTQRAETCSVVTHLRGNIYIVVLTKYRDIHIITLYCTTQRGWHNSKFKKRCKQYRNQLAILDGLSEGTNSLVHPERFLNDTSHSLNKNIN